MRAAGHICGAGEVHIVHPYPGSAYNLEPASSSLEHLLSHLHHICGESDARPRSACLIDRSITWLGAPMLVDVFPDSTACCRQPCQALLCRPVAYKPWK